MTDRRTTVLTCAGEPPTKASGHSNQRIPTVFVNHFLTTIFGKACDTHYAGMAGFPREDELDGMCLNCVERTEIDWREVDHD
jgi:hypothetical protein